MSTIQQKIEMLKRLAASTTFPEEADAALEKVKQLEAKLNKCEEPIDKEKPEYWIKNLKENLIRFEHHSRREFAADLLRSYLRKKRLSHKQWIWVKKLSELIDEGKFGYIKVTVE